MNGAIYAAVSGSLAAVERLEITTNNLANVGTAGFKAQYLVVHAENTGEATVGVEEGGGTTAVASGFQTVTDFSQGSIRPSGNPLDVALMGPGFFVVRTPEGERYTRQGQFQLTGDGRLVTAAGHPLQSEANRDIELPPGDIDIDANGGISVDGTRASGLRLVRFPGEQDLVPEGQSLFAPVEDVRPVEMQPGETQVLQGSIEDANVDAIRGLLELIDVARGYEAYMKAMQQVDSTVETAIEQVAGTT
jgi:flagellar basal-body rod protein FlgF